MKAMINGSHIHYEESGPADGQAVVFLHGFPFSREMWQEQVAALSPRYRVLVYDIKGHGLSDVGDGQYTIEGHVNDLFALLDHVKARRPVIAGLSMGGYITLRALERDQDRFAAAVLCDTRSDPDTDEGKIRRFASMAEVKNTGSQQFAEMFVKGVFRPGSLESNRKSVELVRRIISHTPPLSIAGTLLALAARTDTSASLSKLHIPVLILVGESDLTTPPELAYAMHERIKGSELKIVPDAAHMSNLENPAFFNQSLLAFLKKAVPSRQ